MATRFKSANAFFDRDAVLKALRPGVRKALETAGRNVRQAARRSMRRTGIDKKTGERKPSKPGGPPANREGQVALRRVRGRMKTVHLGQLRKFLFYSYDAASGTVVVGPESLSGSKAFVPGLHEFGGADHRNNQYPKRPYMAPAEQRERGKMPSLFEGIM